MTSRLIRSAQGAKPFSANRTKIDTEQQATANGQKYPEIKQRGYYSDIIGADANDGRLGVTLQFFFICYKLATVHIKWKPFTKKNKPY